MSNSKICIPLSVPEEQKTYFKKRYKDATKDSGKFFIFAADQKMEHLNADFYGNGISAESAHPEHIFKIAQQGNVGALATHLGMINRYGAEYSGLNYIVKINGKTNLVQQDVADPCSLSLCDVGDVADLAVRSKLNILGVGYTIYLGSES
ncbi:hypothetical protein KAU11_04555, partial [Candidatus Babeliales bacterium]|nr:hypothetical protein [Candidatus Babeliales bacterium]